MVQIDGESDVTNETSTSSEDSPKQKRTQRNRRANHRAQQRVARNNQNGGRVITNHSQAQALTVKNAAYEKFEPQRYRALEPPLRQHTKLNLTEGQLVHYLRNYLVDEMLQRLLGFPILYDLAPNLAIIYKYPPYEFISQHRSAMANNNSSAAPSTYYSGSPIFVNQNDGLNPSSSPPAKENFGCEINDSDSGQGSGSSSPSDDFELNQAPTIKQLPKTQYMSMVSSQKECTRCGKGFFVTNDGEYVTTEPCLFHWGKVNQFFDGHQMRRIYSCCNRDHNSHFNNGCTANRVHVWTGVSAGLNGPYDGFVRTKRRPGPPPENAGVFALDCEMCFTGCGLELTKVTIIRSDGNLQYESFVRPERDIVDYNTRFSGITEKDLNVGGGGHNNCRRASTASNSSSSSTSSNGYYRSVKSLQEVQKDILKFIFEDTILIGHSIENDLKALKLIHKTIIDTAIAFPHYYGLPYRRSLKSLTKSFLKRDIQTAENGHCSFEDSRACLELMLWKVRKDFREMLEQH
jgi:RNA exonuclease 1